MFLIISFVYKKIQTIQYLSAIRSLLIEKSETKNMKGSLTFTTPADDAVQCIHSGIVLVYLTTKIIAICQLQQDSKILQTNYERYKL